MTKKIVLILFFLILLCSTRLQGAIINIVWTNTIIRLPVGSNINDYANDYEVDIYYMGEVTNSISYYVEKGVDYTTLSTVATDNPGTYTVVYRLTIMDYSFSSKQEITFIVYDDIPPVITILNDVVKLSYGVEANYMNNVIIKDNNTSVEDIAIHFDTSSIPPESLGIFPVRVRATDSENNHSEASFKVHIVDEIGPTIIPLSDLVFNFDYDFDILRAFRVVDNFEGEIAARLQVVGFDPNILGYQDIVTIVTDSSNNKTEASFRVHIEDTMAPIITLKDTNIKIPITTSVTDEVILMNVLGVYDNYAKLSLNDMFIDYSEFRNEIGTHTITLVLTDSCGNTVKKAISVFLHETTAPAITGNDVYIDLYQAFNPLEHIEVSFNYDEYSADRIDVVFNNVNVNQEGIYKIVYQAYNLSGNFSFHELKVYVGTQNPSTNGEGLIYDYTYVMYGCIALIGCGYFIMRYYANYRASRMKF